MPKPKNPATTLSEKGVDDLSFSLDTVVKTSVRKTVSAARYLDALKEKGAIDSDGECICIIKCGDKAIVGGQGELYEKFIATKSISDSFNEHDSFKSVFSPEYETSKLQILRFDQCFKKLPKDARADIAFKPGIDTIFKDRRGPRGVYHKSNQKDAKDIDDEAQVTHAHDDRDQSISLDEAGGDNVAQVFFNWPKQKKKRKKAEATFVPVQHKVHVNQDAHDDLSSSRPAIQVQGNAKNVDERYAVKEPTNFAVPQSAATHKSGTTGVTGKRRASHSNAASKIPLAVKKSKKTAITAKSICNASVKTRRNINTTQENKPFINATDQHPRRQFPLASKAEQQKNACTISDDSMSSLPLKKRSIDQTVSIEDDTDSSTGNSSSSEIDELLKANFSTTATLLAGSQVDGNPSFSDSLEAVMSSQELCNPYCYDESPIEEYFTSKSKHNDSSVFWEENMSKFATDSLL